jgi:metal-responsive CopG/Arc/MetJ family transcriptional regulator
MTLTEDMLREMDKHPISRNVSRSGFVRVAINEKFDRESQKMEKANKNETQSEK